MSPSDHRSCDGAAAFIVRSYRTFPVLAGRAVAGAVLLWLVTATPLPAIDGVVRNHDGRPLPGLEVRVHNGDEVNDGTVCERLTTGADGRFSTAREYDCAVVFEIRGESGAGRIAWNPADETGELEVAYPVRETIVLLHDNDQHFDFNSADDFRERVDDYRERFDDVFLLNAGDIFTRHADRWRDDDESHEEDTRWYRRRALAIVEQMNEVGYDAMTLGNHELAYIETFTREALERARFPLLAANVVLSTDKLPPVRPTTVLHTGTRRSIFLIGLTTGRAEGVKVLNREEVASKFQQEASEHDAVVALTHIGYNADRGLAERFPFLDVIVGAHSHTLLEQAESINGVLVAQAGGNPHHVSGEHPKYLGVITLVLENGKLVDKRGEVIRLPLAVEALAP